MKTRALKLSKGMSLLEITLVLGLTLALITALLFGISAFQDGSDRARCIMNLVNMQKAMRSFMNLYEFKPGVAFKANPRAGISGNLEGNVFGKGKFIETKPTCPSGDGTTQYSTGADKFPDVGEMWITCPNAESKGHVPKSQENL